MIPIESYRITFFIVTTIIVILGVVPSFRYRRLSSFPDMNLVVGTLILIVFPILYLGLRDPFGSWRYLGDTHNYANKFLRIQSDPFWRSKKDLGFYVYMKFIADYFSLQSFFLISMAIYVLPVYFAFLKWFKKYAYFALIAYLVSMSFWSYGVNGIRNGLATSVFVFALSFYDKKWLMALFIFISISFHTTMVLPTLALIVVHFYNNTKLLLKVWGVSIIISLFVGRFLEQSLRVLLTSTLGVFDKRANYRDYTYIPPELPAFRIDFIFYGSLVIGLGYYFIYKRDFKNYLYTRLFNMYIICNTVWLYFIYFPYTNRIAYLSWFLIPVLSVYPIIYSKKLNNQSYFLAGSVLISLFFSWLASFL